METETQKSIEMRDAFAEILIELGEKYENLLFLDADLHTSTKASEFKKRFPDRFIQNGIAEQNMFGIAAGLAFEGFIPMPSTFAVFASRRALDQITISISYPKLNVKIPGSYVGVPTSRAGASHNSIEDVAIMRTIPNMLVADPCSNNDLKAIMRSAMEINGPVYWRISRYELPEIFPDDHTFEWGKGVVISKGEDISLFGTGLMTDFNIRAARILQEEGINAEVIHLASIKPIDRALILESAKKTKCAITSENASINGGFGDAVLEVLAEECPIPVYKIGVRDKFIESGDIEDLFTIHKMQPRDILNAAKIMIKKKESKTL